MTAVAGAPTGRAGGRRRAAGAAGRLRRRSGPRAERVALPWSARIAIAVPLMVSGLAAWAVLYALVFSALQAGRTNSVLYSELRKNLSAATTPIGGTIAPGTPVALLQAPALGLRNEVIVEGTSARDLRSGPGHLRSTPLPGQPGVSVLFGRSVTYGSPFAKAPSLPAGARFTLTTGQGVFTYAVDRVRRPGDPVPAPLPPGGSRLVLETTTTSVLGLASATTVYVDASLVGGTVVAAPPGRPTSVPTAEQAMSRDTSAFLPLVLWLQGLALAAALAVWGWVRWGRWQAWALGGVLVVASLWGTTNTASLLLPNLL